VNDVVMHVAQEELPFGGIGPAGMGAYHGHDGFREFSHRKSVYHQMKNDMALRMLRPPYGVGIGKYLASQIKR
jgi:coniferyl-aldehyde dehydrogenase